MKDSQRKVVSKNTKKSQSVRYKRSLALGMTYMSDTTFPSQVDQVVEHTTMKGSHEKEIEDNGEQDSVHMDHTAVTNCEKRRGRSQGLGQKRKTATKVSLPGKKRRSRGKVRKSKSFISTSSDGSLSELELPPAKRTNAELVPSLRPFIVSTSSGDQPDESSSEEIIRPRNRRGLSEERRQGCFKVFDRVYNFGWSEPFRFEIRRDQVPDYFSVVKNPMYFRLIACKLRRGDYSSVKEFVSDMKLVFDNCRQYHRPNPLPISPKLLVAATMVEGYLAKELRSTFPDIDFTGLLGSPC
ncbi:uncharacterized protein LOC135480449 [Liolophura sinensis]|uniref:uncharacterized protein LOC135480449 n=1 Tax=Liolophura sinensis TaxID=3198878 RepID=UPI003158F819